MERVKRNEYGIPRVNNDQRPAAIKSDLLQMNNSQAGPEENPRDVEVTRRRISCLLLVASARL